MKVNKYNADFIRIINCINSFGIDTDLEDFKLFFAPENMEKHPQKLLIMDHQFQYSQLAQNQPKSVFLQ